MKRASLLLLGLSLAVAALAARPSEASACFCSFQQLQECREICGNIDLACTPAITCFAGNSCNCGCNCP